MKVSGYTKWDFELISECMCICLQYRQKKVHIMSQWVRQAKQKAVNLLIFAFPHGFQRPPIIYSDCHHYSSTVAFCWVPEYPITESFGERVRPYKTIIATITAPCEVDPVVSGNA